MPPPLSASVVILFSRYNSLQHAVEVIDKEALTAKHLLDEGDYSLSCFPSYNRAFAGESSEIASLGRHFVRKARFLFDLLRE
jgi:hypothetical protein